MIPQRFQKILLEIDQSFGPVHLVGGAVRDAWIKKFRKSRPLLTTDFDLILPKQAREAAETFCKKTAARLVVLDEGRKIFRAAADQLCFDFADYQAKNLEEDLSRRDFTINALALPVNKAFSGTKETPLDTASGLSDLKKKIIRCPSEDVLTQDPLRLIRALRFSAELGFSIEPKTFSWIARHRVKLRRPAPERIRQELLRLLMTPNAATTLKLMDQAGLLTQLFPALERSRNLAPEYYKQGGVLGHVLEAVFCFETSVAQIPRRLPSISKPLLSYIHEPISGGFPRYAVIKLAVLLHDIAKPHTAKKIEGRLRFFGHDKKGALMFGDIGKRLRLSGEEIRLGAAIIRSHLRPGNLSDQAQISDRAVYRFFRDLGSDGVGVLLNALADHQSYMTPRERWNFKERHLAAVRHLLTKYYHEQEIVAPPVLITGHDVMKTLKISPGPAVGKCLEKIKALQAEQKIRTREEALAALKKINLAS